MTLRDPVFHALHGAALREVEQPAALLGEFFAQRHTAQVSFAPSSLARKSYAAQRSVAQRRIRLNSL